MKKFFVLLAIAAMCGSITQALTSDGTGTYNGFYYMLYHSGGSVNMTLGSSAGNWACSWSGVSDVVTGMGWSTGSSSRNIGYNCGSISGYNSLGVYGWTTSPLVEYYVVESGNPSAGSNMGSVTSDGSSYTVWHHQQVSQPSIVGTTTFWQNIDIRSSQRTSGTISMSNHVSSWSSKGMGLGSHNIQVVAAESWGSQSGYVNCTVWDAGSGSTTTTASSTSTTTTSGSSTSTTTTSGSSTSTSGGSSGTIVVRARGVTGAEQIQLYTNSSTVATWTLGTSYANYTYSGSNSGTCSVIYTNDASGRDVQVDYVVINGTTKQAEAQATNTGVWQNNKCGGSNSEWLNCNGYIGF